MSAAGKMPTDVKREEFRKFVERSGITEMIINVITDLYKEQFQEPEEALEFFRNRLAVSSDRELQAANARIQELEAKIAILQSEKST